MLVQRTVDQLQRDCLARRHTNGIHLRNCVEDKEWNKANRYVDINGQLGRNNP